MLIGQLRVQMPPKATGTPPLLKLLVDILGFYDYAQQAARLPRPPARLEGRRDRRSAAMLVVSGATSAHDPTFVLAAGGFHPRFKDIPPGDAGADRPARVRALNRPGQAHDRGLLRGHAATVQAGADVARAGQARAGLDRRLPRLRRDRLPRAALHFEVDLRAGVAVKFKGHTLAPSIELEGTLDRARAAGASRARSAFDPVVGHHEVDFDESWGSAPASSPTEVDVARARAPSSRTPATGAPSCRPAAARMVTPRRDPGRDGLLAHPLGSLIFIQRVAPLGLELQRFGAGRVEGATRFDVDAVHGRQRAELDDAGVRPSPSRARSSST